MLSEAQAWANSEAPFEDAADGSRACWILLPTLADVLKGVGNARFGTILRWSDRRLLVDLGRGGGIEEGDVQMLIECEDWIVVLDAHLRKFEWLLWDDQRKVCFDLEGVSEGLLSRFQSSFRSAGTPIVDSVASAPLPRAMVDIPAQSSRVSPDVV